MMKKVFTFLIFSFLTSRIFAQGYGNFPYSESFMSGLQPAEITIPSNSNPVSFTTNGMFLTPNQTQYFGAAYFNNIKFSSPQGIKIEFEYGMYGSSSLTNGADGLSVFLFDASVTDPQVGADGEGLAYTYQRATQTYSTERRKGLSGAYLGIGLDAWGAFHERTFTTLGDRRKSGLGAKLTNNKSQVTLRGAEGKTNLDNVGRQAGYNGYPLLITKSTRSGSGSGAILNNDGTFTTTTGTTDNFYLNTLAFGNSPTDLNYRKAFIELLPNPAGGYNITVKIQHGSAITTIIDNYHYKTSVTYIENANNALYEMGASYINDYIPTANSIPGNNSTHTLDTSVPQYFRIGFGASTGNGMNNHVIRNLKVTLPYAAVAVDDSFTVDCNTNTFNVLTNDLAYANISNPTASNVNIDKTSFRFIDVSGNPQGHSYTEAGKGTWMYDQTTGIVTFTPLSNYTAGTAQIRYDIKGIESPFNEEAYRSVPATITATVTATNCPVPFDCETAGMFFSYGSASNVTLHRVNTASNPFTYPAFGSAAGYSYNAIGFNPVDGFIYGLKNNNIIRIDSNGTYTDLGAVAGLPSGSYIAGEIDNLGNYYVKVGNIASTVLYKINISTLTATTITLSKSFMTGDLAFNPVDGLLYGVMSFPSTSVDYGKLLSVNPATGAVNVIGSTNSPNNFTAMFGSLTGETFGIGINGGFYQFNLITGERVLISDSPAGSNADGAHCVNSTIKFNADLYVTKTDNKTYYIPGATTTYTVVVGNNGPFGSMGATVSDPVPTGVPAANVSYTATVSGGATTTVTGTQTGAINDVVGLPVGGKVTYTVTVTVPSDYTGDLINTVTVTPPSNTTDSDMSNNSVTDIDTAACFKPAVTSGTALATNHGITALGRAGADNPDNWPMVRKGAWTVLEAKTKGFVPNRLTDAQMTAIPAANLVEGMMIYNITQQCLMINTDGTATGWNCFNTQACPE